MKVIKKMLSIGLCLLFVLNMIMSVPKVTAAKNGFSYGKNYTVEWKNAGSYSVYTDEGGKLGTMTYTVGRARYKKTKQYMLLVKMVMTPNESKVKCTKYLKGYGLSEYVSVKSTLPGTLCEYKPVNDPKKDSVNLSLGVSKGGPEVSASYSVTHEDLDITAKCNTPKKKYYIVYDYKPSVLNLLADNKYVANESQQYGMAQFDAKDAKKITITFDSRFGFAYDNSASPWKIDLGSVWKKTKNVTYNFN